MLVRESCGGRGKINEAFCSQFEYIHVTSGESEGLEPATGEDANLTLMPEEVAPGASEPISAVG